MKKFRSPQIHSRLFSQERFTTTLQWGFYLALTAVVMSTLSLIITATRTTPQPPDTTEAFNRISRAQFVAQNYLRLWLTATEADKASFKVMLSDQNAIPKQWATDPLQVSDVNTANIESRTAEDGQTVQWSFIIGATITTPGNDNASRNYFAITLMDRPGTAIRAVMLPRPVNSIRPNIAVTLDYPNSVPATTTLGAAVANFANAYYTDQTGSLPSYTSREFHHVPIVGTPYTSTELISIRSTTPFTKTAKEGTTLDVIAEIKASISASSFQTISVPMRVKAIENGQWVVDDLTDFVYYSKATETK
ncbi:hypothetical protein [Gordonia malaquae]|uniref:hypothetical protein n=1 Tax=Gordonia malaquae TaxID=410332 RepID=UPI0030169EFA